MNKRPAVSPLQHNEEIYRNLEAWNRKPLLQRVYFGFYCEMARYLSANAHGLTVELGSGIGNIKKVIPHCITTDIFPNPWLDRQENAYRLSLAEGSVSNLILFDVWHHLQFPGTALKEFGRVLSRKGRLILFEPGMGLLGRLIYSVAHHEPLASHEPIEWFAPTDFSPDEIRILPRNHTPIVCSSRASLVRCFGIGKSLTCDFCPLLLTCFREDLANHSSAQIVFFHC